MKRLVPILLAFGLLAGACGNGNDDTSQVGAGDDPAAVVDNEPGGDEPAVAGACVEDVPDCVDTVVVDEPDSAADCESDAVDCNDAVEEPAAPIAAGEPNGTDPDAGATSSGVVVGGGLTITEALATDATGVLAVQGFLLSDGTDIRLCEALAESMPPQCGGAQLLVEAADVTSLVNHDVPLASAQGVSWTDMPVTLFGELVDGVFVVDPLVAG